MILLANLQQIQQVIMSSHSAHGQIQEHMKKILDDISPKARLISQMHVEDYIDSIYMEIINGDSEIATEVIPFQQKCEKHGFQDILRKKILDQSQREKRQLQHKLHYLSNSINALKQYEGERRSPTSLRASYSVQKNRVKQTWRKDIEERSKNLEQKKKEVEQFKNKKMAELKQIDERVKQEELEKRKKQLEQNVKNIGERMKKREEEANIGNIRYNEIKKEKRLFHKLSQSYNEKQLSFLEERKKKLAEIRDLHKPLDEEEIREHEQRFLELKKQKEEMREREKRMNESRSNSYQPFYKSVFYQKALEESRAEVENVELAKIEKVKQFSSHVRENHAPSIDQKKREELEEKIEKQKRKEQEKAEKDEELKQKLKQKGIQYLQLVRKLPKKPKQKAADAIASKTDRQQYPNYLTHSKTSDPKPWRKILTSSEDKQSKALQLQFQSSKREEELKRRQQQVRILNKGDSGQIDQEYYDMIKAKLDLLEIEK